MLEIVKHIVETPSVKTIRFAERLDAMPGQFVMVWMPGVDEFPMSLSYIGNRFGITYQIVGEGTRALAARRLGDRVGIRGPYGKGFSLRGKKLLVVGGGTGMAAVAPLVAQAIAQNAFVSLVLGARTSKDLLFERRLARAGAKVNVSTDDGSKGFKGLASELAEEMLAERKFDQIYACGPERMIVRLLSLATKKRIPLQASLERIMKCGIGICDSCALDGKHVCKDGPVFSREELQSFEDLGRTKLDLAGRKVPL